MKLSPADQNRIIQILLSVRMLSNEQGREALLITAGLQDLLPQIQLAGPSAITLPILVNFLISYGRLTYEHEALGRLLNTLKDYVGVNDQMFINNIITKYHLMTPTINSPTEMDWLSPVLGDEYFEKIIGENSLRHIAFLEKALDVSRSVSYIEVSSAASKWSGTGFLIGKNILLTNHHVLPDKHLLGGAIFRFNYQLDKSGNPELFEDYTANDTFYYANRELDYAVIELSGEPGMKWGWLELSDALPEVNKRVNIIQHPAGLPKQISFQNNFIQYIDKNKLQYVTSTLPGSSGSPVFNDEWKVIAIHHAGGWLPETDPLKVYFRNEGIPIVTILNSLSPNIKALISNH